ncbi:MAG: acyl-CoA dehydrogenase family protein [Flavobacteriaceae bacterium]|nr:acyl-CoA dehydrogenase family protein [Flavobacteriaceae bacterium]
MLGCTRDAESIARAAALWTRSEPSGLDFALARANRVRDEIRAFLHREFSAEDAERERREGGGHDWPLYRKLAADGWVSAGWPKAIGGGGRDPYEILALYWELSKAGFPWFGLMNNGFIGHTLTALGTEAQKRELVPRIAQGEILVALGYSEPGAGSDVAAARTQARRDGEDWILDGEKMWTTTAHEAQYVFTLTRTTSRSPSPAHDSPRPTSAGVDQARPHARRRAYELLLPARRSRPRRRSGRRGRPGLGRRALRPRSRAGDGLCGSAGALPRGGARLGADGGRGRRAALRRSAGPRAARAIGDPRRGRTAAASSLDLARRRRSPPRRQGRHDEVVLCRDLPRRHAGLGRARRTARAARRRSRAGSRAGSSRRSSDENPVNTIYGGTVEILRSLVAEIELGLPKSR